MESFNNWIQKKLNEQNNLQEFGGGMAGFTTAPPVVSPQGAPVTNQMYQIPGTQPNPMANQVQQATQMQVQQQNQDRQMLFDLQNKLRNPVLKAGFANWLKRIFPRQNMGNVGNTTNITNMPNQVA